MLVDDNADIRLSVKDVLSEIGYVCDVADGGKVALQKLATHSYDAMLLDISMPGMDGFEVARTLRSGPGRNQHIPIMTLSAYSPEEPASERDELFSAHISKPVRMSTLQRVLEDVFEPETDQN